MGRATRIRGRLLAIAVGVLAAGLVGELWFRFARPNGWRRPIPADTVTVWSHMVHQPSRTPGLRYELRPNCDAPAKGVRVITNSFGLRGREIERAKPPGTLRVAAIGDSVTFGFNVQGEDSWPAQLERALAEIRTEPVEVLNFGVGGYSARDCAAVVEQKALELAPDLLIYAYFLNDPETEPLQPLHQFFADVEWWQHSALLRRVMKLARDRRVERFGGGDDVRALHAPTGPWWPSVLDALDRIQRAASVRQIPVLVVIFPTYQDRASWSDYPYRPEHERVAAVARERGFDVFDLDPVFASSSKSPRELSSDLEHPSVEGNRIAAAAIAALLAKRASWNPSPTR